MATNKSIAREKNTELPKAASLLKRRGFFILGEEKIMSALSRIVATVLLIFFFATDAFASEPGTVIQLSMGMFFLLGTVFLGAMGKAIKNKGKKKK